MHDERFVTNRACPRRKINRPAIATIAWCKENLNSCTYLHSCHTRARCWRSYLIAICIYRLSLTPPRRLCYRRRRRLIKCHLPFIWHLTGKTASICLRFSWKMKCFHLLFFAPTQRENQACKSLDGISDESTSEWLSVYSGRVLAKRPVRPRNWDPAIKSSDDWWIIQSDQLVVLSLPIPVHQGGPFCIKKSSLKKSYTP